MGRSLPLLVLALVLASCGASDQSNAPRDEPDASDQDPVSSPDPTASDPLPVDESVTPSPEPTLQDSTDSAYDMPYLEETLEEGDDPSLDDDTEMYVFIHSAQEGTPFVVQVRGIEDLLFNARTPYYLDLDDSVVNEYGNVGSGSILIRNGHTEGSPLYVTYDGYTDESGTESCEGYDCDVLLSWSGYDIIP